MRVRWALIATLFYALNPNLLYLATTAMTEALFLALFVWVVVVAVECVAAIRASELFAAKRHLLWAGLLVLLMVFTRYDGWIVGAAVWCCLAWQVWRTEATTRTQLWGAFIGFTLLCLAGPLLWFWYNAHFDHDWLDFMRGPYSAAQIERRTAPPGQHYRGWHNPGWSTMFYLRTAQIDASVWETGWALLLSALYGAWRLVQKRREAAIRGRGDLLALLLWVPLPFYIYSVAYGSVPIFIPELWPHAFYNARYGMEMLPAFSVFGAMTGEGIEQRLRQGIAPWEEFGAQYLQRTAVVLCVLNSLLMMNGTASLPWPHLLHHGRENPEAKRERLAVLYDPIARRYALPLVLQEGLVNARTRIPFEHSLAEVLETMPANVPVLMSISAHVGAVQDAGRDLRSVISENDEVGWQKALADPALSAAYVIALAGDPVARAVETHPQGLSEIEVVRTVGQPAARVYQSLLYKR